ncbi:hypothetical protein BC830DRAFT_1164808 [Chytriomyces sp. MP71]|nr:hypothetical protein BC830DRAFT_1164808 [Chytriomyces sp. MP71]
MSVQVFAGSELLMDKTTQDIWIDPCKTIYVQMQFNMKVDLLESITFLSSLKLSFMANQLLFTPADGLPTKPSISSGKYVGVHPVNKVHYTLPSGFMPAKLDYLDTPKAGNSLARLVIPGKEEDITKCVGSINTTFMLPLMLAHPDKGVCLAFVMKDAVVTYGSSIGKPSKKTRIIPGKEPVYMKSYAFIGFPVECINWIITSLCELHDICIADNEQYFGKNDGKCY